MLDQKTDSNPGLTLSDGADWIVRQGGTLAEMVHIFNATYAVSYSGLLTGKYADRGDEYIRFALERWRLEDA